MFLQGDHVFNGFLLVTSREVFVFGCGTQINVQNDSVFLCPTTAVASMSMKVQSNQSVSVRAEYLKHFTSGTFYHCLRFQQNGNIINLSVFLSYDIRF